MYNVHTYIHTYIYMYNVHIDMYVFIHTYVSTPLIIFPARKCGLTNTRFHQALSDIWPEEAARNPYVPGHLCGHLG